MARRWPVLAGVPCAVAATLASAPARAFTIDGHDAIEAAAYRRLAAAHAVDDGRGGTVPGRAALAFLIRRGFLARPRCFEPAPADAAACAKDAKDEPLAFWPELLSGSADLVSARQFSTNGQCFHFMAPTEYAWTTPRDARLGVPRGFATEAYWRCTRALSELFFESLRDPSRANHENRGLYAVMHGVADSFSAAHVERDRAWRILYLKPWRARAFLSYLPPGHWAGLHYVGGPSHHGIVDGRDDEFVRQDDAACREYKHAYALPEGCLTERGDRAARAIVDLMVTVQAYARRAEAGERVDSAEAFRGFVARNLESAVVTSDLRAPFRDEREWNPAFVFGFRFRNRPIPGATDLTAIAGASLFSDVTMPILPFFSLEAGCRRVAGACRFVAGADPVTLMIPITEGFAIGATPLSVLASSGPAPNFAAYANVVRADLYLFDALWISASGPSYSWVHHAFDGAPLTLSMGFAWDGKLALPGAPPARSPPPVELRADRRDLGGAPTDEPWRPPALVGPYRRHAATVLFHLVGATLLPDDAQGAYSIGGVEVLFDRDRWNRRAGFALGARVDSEVRPTRADDHVGGVGGPVARYYIVPNRFALEIDPALVDAGYETDEQGHGAPFIDVGASGAATFVPFGRVEIAVEGPRFSYRTLDRVPGTNLGLRLGFSLD